LPSGSQLSNRCDLEPTSSLPPPFGPKPSRSVAARVVEQARNFTIPRCFAPERRHELRHLALRADIEEEIERARRSLRRAGARALDIAPWLKRLAAVPPPRAPRQLAERVQIQLTDAGLNRLHQSRRAFSVSAST
jgi:hypothetical protein